MASKNGCPLELENSSVFRFVDYDFIGIDMDHTLVSYNLTHLLTEHFEYLSNFLRDRQNYCGIPTSLSPDLIDFISRGLVIDVETGNLLKTTSSGRIVRGSHGTQRLTPTEIQSQYGHAANWPPLLDAIAHNFSDWTNRRRQMYSFMDFTDAAASAIYGLAIDSGRPPLQVYDDVIAAIVAMYDDPEWDDRVFSDSKYFRKASPDLSTWLQDLRKHSKIALISSNYHHLVQKIATMGLGDDWRSFFDLVVAHSRKPMFFTEDQPFLNVDGSTADEFNWNASYLKGSMRQIEKKLREELGREPKCLYIGDSPLSDFVFTPIDYVAVVEEVDARNRHPDADFVSSSFWGDYLLENGEPTLFGQMALKAKIVIPGIEMCASKPIDFEYSSKLAS